MPPAKGAYVAYNLCTIDAGDTIPDTLLGDLCALATVNKHIRLLKGKMNTFLSGVDFILTRCQQSALASHQFGSFAQVTC